MKRVTRLAILLLGEHVADLERTRSGALRLRYQPSAAEPGRTPLSLALVPERGDAVGPAVERYLWGLLPENAGALRAIERLYGVDARDPLSLLAAIGLDCSGAVQFCAPDEVEGVVARPGHLEEAQDIEGRLAELRMGDEASWTMTGEHWSLGGTQQKFTVTWSGDTWHYPRGSAPSTHVIKPGVRTVRHQALIEHLSMAAGRRLGLEIADSRFEDFASERAIVVERFDRVTDPSGQVHRVHQEDLCQALGVEEKYEEYGGPGAVEIARLLREQAASAAQGERNVEAFMRGIVYNTVIAAPDAHARNYAVLLAGDEVTLAPLYDVATGLAYDVAQPRLVAMSVGGTFTHAEIDLAALARTARDLDLVPSATTASAQDIAARAAGAFEAEAELIDDWDGAVSHVMERLGPRFRELEQRWGV